VSDDSKLKPVNVTAEHAEAYLEVNGWVPDHRADKKGNWLSRNGVSFSRGQAVLHQFEKDYITLAFVMQHTPPELLATLIPPTVLAKVMEIKSKLTGDPTN